MATQEKKEVRVGSIVSCVYLHEDRAEAGIVLSIAPPQRRAGPRPLAAAMAVVKWFKHAKPARFFLYELRLIKQ